MAYGFNTHKTDAGYEWSVTQTVWNNEIGRSITTKLQAGIRPTRAQAEGMAKKWVLFYRRGGKVAA